MPDSFSFPLDNAADQPDRPLNGAYFLTLGVEKGESIFGVVERGQVLLNPVGLMVAATWRQIPEEFFGVSLDEFIVMPNHFHAIVRIDETPQAQLEPSFPHPPNLGEIVAVFKTRTKALYLENIRRMGWEIFNFRLWEKSYFDRKLLTLGKLAYARQYIRENPQHWTRDWENPDWLET